MRHGPRSGLMLHSLCAGLTRASIKKSKLFPRPWIARSSPAMTSPYVDSTRCGRLSTPLPFPNLFSIVLIVFLAVNQATGAVLPAETTGAIREAFISGTQPASNAFNR